jgi:hypothetical protein
MTRISFLIGLLGTAAFVSACGSTKSGGGGVPDSGPDSTAEGGGSTPEAGPDATTDAPMSDAPSSTDAADAGAPSEASASCTAFDAGTLDDAAVAAGLQFILSTGHCNKCHQTDPDAGIALSGNMFSITDAGPVFPPNLTPDPVTGLGCWSNDQIANAILFGVDPEGDGGSLCRLMPKFGVGKGDAAAPLDDASVENVVAFLRSLPPVVNEVQTTICPGLAPTPDGGTPDSAAADGGDAGVAAGDAGDAASE